MKNQLTDKFEKQTGYCYTSMQALNNLIHRALYCNCDVELLLKANLALLKQGKLTIEASPKKFLQGFDERSKLKEKYLVTEEFLDKYYKGIIKRFRGVEYLEEVKVAAAVNQNKKRIIVDDDALFTATAAIVLCGYGSTCSAYCSKKLQNIPSVRNGRFVHYRGKDIMKHLDKERREHEKAC